MTTLRLDLGERGYDINIGRGLLFCAAELFDLNRRVFILTDSGVPAEYAEAVRRQCREAVVHTVEEGEGAKSPRVYSETLLSMLDFGLTRTDCLVAVGGGVVGDLGGFLAATYMRGIDFYNIPTTLLSQVDSSIGGKTAINLGGVKNIVGAFHQPRGVICDPSVLVTLPRRHISNGLAEAIKMSVTSDAELFSLIEESDIDENIEEIILRSLMIKKRVVEEDEREGGIRKILNFGHSFGHCVEAEEKMNGLYHGECVSVGMTAVSSDKVKKRLIPVLKKAGLPTEYSGDIDSALSFLSHDKKCDGSKLSVVLADEIGAYRIEKMDVSEFASMVKEKLKK